MKKIMTIQAGEGGTDSRLLVKDFLNYYTKLFKIKEWDYS